MNNGTNPPLAHPVTAWAVVDKDGKFEIRELHRGEPREGWLRSCNDFEPHRAPHRIARVEIREIAPPKEQG